MRLLESLANVLTKKVSRGLLGLLGGFILFATILDWKHIEPSLSSSSPSIKPAKYSPREELKTSESTSGQSLKVLTYVFPQFHPIPENDKAWGVNFTEWTYVQPLKKNAIGLDVLQPAPEVGYYNLLDYETRLRQGKLIKEMGIHGAIFHHYWFGKPVMDGVLNKMLADGEPSVPFVLSWANEQWTRNWKGGGAGEVTGDDLIIAQDYGDRDAWKVHFDWLLQFFLHPLYIRDHGRVVFIIYRMVDFRDLAKPMIEAFKGWALEAGFELEVLQTNWQWDPLSEAIDGVLDFSPHSSGIDHDTNVYGRAKRHAVHSRGTLVCWDNTPRHTRDKEAGIWAFCHPDRFEQHLIRMLEFAKLTPNPTTHDNYFAINALNEWGEGNTLEPSQVWHSRYASAVRKAIDYSEAYHKWLPDRMWSLATNQSTSEFVSICYLIGVSARNGNDDINSLQNTMRALQTQENSRFSAIIFAPSKSSFPGMKELIDSNMDERFSLVEIAAESVTETYDKSSLHKGADWILKNIVSTGKNTACQNSQYIHVTEGHNQYSKTAFSVSKDDKHDIVALTTDQNSAASVFYSRLTRNKIEATEWSSMCDRLKPLAGPNCPQTQSDSDTVDLSAVLIKTSSWNAIGAKFGDLDAVSVWKSLSLLVTKNRWLVANRKSKDCDVLHHPSVASCRKAAGIWRDSPISEEVGCYSASQLRSGPPKDWQDEVPEFDNLNDQTGKYDARYDLDRYRRDPWCIRYTKSAYDKRVKALSSA